MKILITGKNGQLAQALVKQNSSKYNLISLSKDEFNLENHHTLKNQILFHKPDWIINTSCEHMSTLWYDSVDKDQLIVMQTNNSDEFDGHINPCYTQKEMQAKYPLSETLYVGALETPAYTRYMQIGYK